MIKINKPKIFRYSIYPEYNGSLIPFYTKKHFPKYFKLKRFFILYGKKKYFRADHAHKKCSQIIIPLRGKGLWGPIWGFISLESDLNSVFGAVFDHKAETPGLGAEINQDFFQSPFKGKEIFKDNTLMSVKVVKGGASKDDLYAVDGISGGTITSDGVTDMLYERLSMYTAYLNKMKKSNEVESMILELDS